MAKTNFPRQGMHWAITCLSAVAEKEGNLKFDRVHVVSHTFSCLFSTKHKSFTTAGCGTALFTRPMPFRALTFYVQ